MPTVYLKNLRIVGIFFKDLQESIFGKTLVSQLGVGGLVLKSAEEDSQQDHVFFFFKLRSLNIEREREYKKVYDEKWQG